MRIGVPQEIKSHEYRVGLSPASVRALCARGHEVIVQSGAGQAIGMLDEQYRAADAVLTKRLLDAGVVGVAYETITSASGGLPLLAPMSEVAGRMSIQAAATHLEKSRGGLGILPGGVPDVPPAHVVVLGAGMIRSMRSGSVVVDVAIDQGGCFETSHPTTHDEPTYVVHGVVHCCVANMPGAVARTSTLALNNATLPYATALADHGWQQAMRRDPHLLAGLNACNGQITHKAVAESLNLTFTEPGQMLAS